VASSRSAIWRAAAAGLASRSGRFVPCSRAQGNPAEGCRKIGRFWIPEAPREPGIRADSQYLPWSTANLWTRDGFAADCTHRQPVYGGRDFAAVARDPPRNSRAFAGSWEMGTVESEPETRGRPVVSVLGARSSLRPIPAVRFRRIIACSSGLGIGRQHTGATRDPSGLRS
jgi:hypothetical protein